MTNETYEQLEMRVQNLLDEVGLFEPGSKEQGVAVSRVVSLMDVLVRVDKDDAEAHDKAERRRIDESRNEATAQIEKEKQSLTKERAIFEMVKTFGPLALSIIAFGIFQSRMIQFEETGRFTSQASREMHLPNFFNFVKK